MQVQQLRQRLNNDADARVEEVERLRRADRQRLEAALEKAREEAMQHEGAAGAAAEKQRKELMQAHEKALAAAREEWDAQQAGWRAAVAERASREVHRPLGPLGIIRTYYAYLIILSYHIVSYVT